MKPLERLQNTCDVCNRRRGGSKPIDHSHCSKVRQARWEKENRREGARPSSGESPVNLKIIYRDGTVAVDPCEAQATLPAEDHTLFDRVIQRFADRGYHEGRLYLGNREPSGWLEYTLHLFDKEGKRYLVIGCIQRRPGAEVEFHS